MSMRFLIISINVLPTLLMNHVVEDIRWKKCERCFDLRTIHLLCLLLSLIRIRTIFDTRFVELRNCLLKTECDILRYIARHYVSRLLLFFMYVHNTCIAYVIASIRYSFSNTCTLCIINLYIAINNNMYQINISIYYTEYVAIVYSTLLIRLVETGEDKSVLFLCLFISTQRRRA